MREYVYTERGRGWARDIVPVTRSGGIIIPRSEVKLHMPEKPPETLPAGTPLMRHQKLERDTAKKPRAERRSHLVFEEGLHSLERMCVYVQRFEREDGAEMFDRRAQMQTLAKELYVCGQLSFEDHARIKEHLAYVRESFDEWKRADRKVEVREHIDTANAQRSKVGRYKAMPAASAAFASRRDIQARLQETMEIHAAFGTNHLRVCELLDDVWHRTDTVWKIFQPGGADRLPREIAFAMDSTTRSHPMVRVVTGQLEDFGRELAQIYAQPYLPIANATRLGFERLARGVQSHRRRVVADTVQQIRASLRRVRMLYYVEMSLIRVLSFPSHSENGPVFRPHTIKAFKERLKGAVARVRDMTDGEFDPDLRHLVRDYLVATRTNVEQERYEDARVELKRLTRELRIQPLLSGRAAA